VVQAHRDSRPFGRLLKSLLHGRLEAQLRCGRLDIDALPADCSRTAALLDPWIQLAGRKSSPTPPPGYYLLRGTRLLGYHPEPEDDDDSLRDFLVAGSRGARTWLKERNGAQAGRLALEGRPELEILRFFESAARGTVPRRADSAPDRRGARDRRGPGREGRPRRTRDRLQAELDGAFRLFGLSPDAPMRRVKEVRNRLMREHHPDRPNPPGGVEEATAFAVRVNQAFTAIRRERETSP